MSSPCPRTDWQVFRFAIIDALRALDRDRFVYLDEDTIVGGCPLCVTGYVRVFFHGRATRADIACSLGCDEHDVGRVLTGRAR